MTITGKSTSSGTHYWRAWKSGQIWNGSAYEDYSAGSYANYDIAAVSEGLGIFTGSVPDDADFAELVYQSGGSPATGDLLQWVFEADGGLTTDQQAQLDAIEAKTALIIAGPITVRVPFVATKDLPVIPQYSGPSFQWTVVDSAGTAVDLSGKTVRFVVATVSDEVSEFSKYDDVLVGSFSYQSGTAALVVSGASSNVVTVQVDSGDTETTGEHRYWLWDVTTAGAERVLVKGKFPVEPAVRSV